VLPVYKLETKVGGLGIADGLIGPTVGKTLFVCSFHDVKDRFDFADSRNMSPTRILMHPAEKRRKAEPRVKEST